MAKFIQPTSEGGVDEIHIVYNRFVSMLTQDPEVVRLLPLEVVEGVEEPDSSEIFPLYETARAAGSDWGEPSDVPSNEPGHATEHETLFKPLLALHALCLAITSAITHEIGACG